MQMVYSEILLNVKPWTDGSVLVGLVVEDPKSGRVRIVRAKVVEATPREQGATERFLASLEALAKLKNAAKAPGTVAGVLKLVPDRGTAFHFSPVRSGDFNSVAAALKHCTAKRIAPTLPRPAIVNPVGQPATA